MYMVDETFCNGCGICMDLCSVEAISIENDAAVIDQGLCTECGHCFDGCLRNAVFELNQPDGPYEPVRAASASQSVRTVSPAGTVPKPISGFRSPAFRDKAGPALVAAFPVFLKLAGAVADYVSARAGQRSNASGGTLAGKGCGRPAGRGGHRHGRG